VQTAVLDSWDLNDNAAVARSFLYAALTSPLAADFNADGAVDGEDLARWSAHFGVAATGLLAQGDANRDRTVDGADFLLWQRNVGVAATTAETSAVPEPGGAALLGAAAALLAAARRFS
jgi:hypothetical protein